MIATCPEGSLAVGGGFAGGTLAYVYNTSTKLFTGNEWNVFAQNSSGTDKPPNAYAICLSFP